jgi:ribonuclease Z
MNPAPILASGTRQSCRFWVEHSPASPAYGYRFDYRGRSVVISGDTRKWPPLAVAAKGADVLIHEAQNNDMTAMTAGFLKSAGQARIASIMSDTTSYHTTPVEAAEIAKAAGVRALVLTHLTQAGLPFFTPEAFTKGIDAVGFANWRLAADGMTIDLPVGSTEINFGQF